MNRQLHVVTGATGLLGSHVVEQLIGDGKRVRAVVRVGSDTAFSVRSSMVAFSVRPFTDKG